jgi:Peptidase A4 family
MRFVNFPLTLGDAIFCFIHYDGPGAEQVIYGSVRLLNLTNGTETSAYIAMPDPVTLPAGFLGQTAECIMERPSFRLPDGTLVPHNIPHYGEVTFTDFGACSDKGNAYTTLNLMTIGLKSGDSSGERSEAIVCRPE